MSRLEKTRHFTYSEQGGQHGISWQTCWWFSPDGVRHALLKLQAIGPVELKMEQQSREIYNAEDKMPWVALAILKVPMTHCHKSYIITSPSAGLPASGSSIYSLLGHGYKA